MFSLTQLLRRNMFGGSRRPTQDRRRRPLVRWLVLAICPIAFAAVTATLALAWSAQDGDGPGPDSVRVAPVITARPFSRPTSTPTPAPTAAPTATPTLEPAPPSPPPTRRPAPAPVAQPGAASAALPGTGPNYYVDDVNGNDGNSGTSEATAWRTIEKASAFTLSPGARLLLRRGGVWTGTLKIEESGAGGLPVVIASYGSGPLPIIHGAGDCIALFGSGVVIAQVQAQDCWSGVRIPAAHRSIASKVTFSRPTSPASLSARVPPTTSSRAIASRTTTRCP